MSAAARQPPSKFSNNNHVMEIFSSCSTKCQYIHSFHLRESCTDERDVEPGVSISGVGDARLDWMDAPPPAHDF